jgi:hypothetical protein
MELKQSNRNQARIRVAMQGANSSDIDHPIPI